MKYPIAQMKTNCGFIDYYSSTQFYRFFKGRVALYAILQTLGIGPEDEVILPAFTCIVVPSAVMFCGATPIYADIDPKTYNLDIKTIRDVVSPKTKAIIVQHTFGLPVEMTAIVEFAKTRGFFIIEDCAHCLGSYYDGRLLGQWGDAAFFSTQWSKPITTGLGGIAIINNQDLKARFESIISSYHYPNFWSRARLYIQHLAYKALFSPGRYWMLMQAYRKLGQMGLALASSDNEELNVEKPDCYEMRMGSYQEKLLSNMLSDKSLLMKLTTHRRTISEFYERQFRNTDFILPDISSKASPIFLRYPLRVKNKSEILTMAEEQSLEIGDWFVSPLHPNVEDLDKLDYHWGQCPQAEKVCREVINLPTHMGVSKMLASKISDFMKLHAEPGV